MTKVSRRNVVRGAAALAAGAAAAKAASAAVGAANDTKNDTKDAKKPDPNAITAADVAVLDKIQGRDNNEAERKQMLGGLEGKRKAYKAVRESPFAAGDPAIRFDPRLPGMAVPSGKDKVTPSRGAAPAYAGGNVESLAFCTATELGRLLKAKKVTSTELTRMYLGRLKRYGPRLLCVVSLTEESALAEAKRADAEIASGRYRGPLHGVPYAVKDLLAAKGTHTTDGVSPYKDRVTEEDSTVVARLREAGAVLLAKLSMGELAMGDVWFGGRTRNPWKPDSGSSGSSAGSASATAAGLVGFAIGTETLGSITSPCSVCGTTGLRPTFGRVSRHGAMALSWTMDKIGPITRGVEDCALIFAAIHGPDGQDATLAENIPFRWQPESKLSDLRVGIDQKSWRDLQKSKDKDAPARLKIYDAALDKLRSLGGVTLHPLELPDWHDEYGTLTGLTISVEGAASFEKLRADGGLRQLVQQDDWNWPNSFRVASTVPASDYLEGMRIRAHLQREMAHTLRDTDVYVTIPFNGPSLSYTNLCGQPTVITRCGKTEAGLPVSLEFTGNLYREDAALRLAFAFEQATGWHKLWPDVTKLPETPPKEAKAG